MQANLPSKHMSGFTLVEMIVAMALTSIVMGFVYFGLSTMTRSNKESENISEMHRDLQAAILLLKRDIAIAGFKVASDSTFETMDPTKIKFSFEDIIGSSCSVNDSATIEYKMENGTIIKSTTCNGGSTTTDSLFTAPDSLYLKFTYYDEKETETAVDENLKMVEITVAMFTNNNGSFAEVGRTVKKKVYLNNM